MKYSRYAKIKMLTGMMEIYLRGQSLKLNTKGLPHDISVVGVHQPEHGVNDFFYVIVEHKSFKAIRQNEPIPELPIALFHDA